MFVWEMVAQRMRREGWEVDHCTLVDDAGSRVGGYHVRMHRHGYVCEASATTLTEAYSIAGRRALALTEFFATRPTGFEATPAPHLGRPHIRSRVHS